MVATLARAAPGRSAPRVEARGLGIRLGEGDAARTSWIPGDRLAGVVAAADGVLEVVIERTDHGDAVTLALALRNAGDVAVHVDAVVVGARWVGHGIASHRFLRHGWQSWSFTGFADLDEAGEGAFPSGAWLRGMYHCQGAPSPERAGWHESESVTVVGAATGGPCCLAGVLETGRAFGIVHARLAGPTGATGERAVDLDVEQRVECTLAPGATRPLEAVRFALDTDATRLLERFATLWGRLGDARTGAPFQAGWCSWYHYFHRISEDELLRNLDLLVRDREAIPIEVVQLDDGYQRTIGDWLHTNDRFPRGLAHVASSIRGAGFVPGLWTAPFAASAESTLLVSHPDRALRHGDGWLRGTHNPAWSADGWVYALDPGHPGLRAHLEETYRALVALGFPYQKLDFLYMAAMEGGSADPGLTRAERLRAGLEAVRRGAGEEAFLLGCGCPLGPAVGLVDGMRIGPDVAPCWGVDRPDVIPGLERMLPSTASALRSIEARLFMHRRLWLNDPDCLMARTRETALRPEEARSLAAAIAISGGMAVVSDDLSLLDAAERALVERVVATGRRIDGGAGAARVVEPLAPGRIRRLEACVGSEVWHAALNVGDEPVRLVDVGALPGAPASGHLVPELSGGGEADDGWLAPHASRVARHPGRRALAVFCDFDGTFSVRDVGSTIAQQRLPDRRKALARRYEAGEVDAWEYAELLFDGLEYGPDELDTFLRGLALDPGAPALVDWCDRNGASFRILSDGFDHNLERLQAIHGVRFAYSANHLSFDGDRWRISAGGRNAACDCGTGCCKRAAIEAHRRAHPDDCVVHIGNGRVSDRCGAAAADRVFAKESLAEELADRGIAFEPFRTLEDVVAALDADWGEGRAAGPTGAAGPVVPG